MANLSERPLFVVPQEVWRYLNRIRQRKQLVFRQELTSKLPHLLQAMAERLRNGTVLAAFQQKDDFV